MIDVLIHDINANAGDDWIYAAHWAIEPEYIRSGGLKGGSGNDYILSDDYERYDSELGVLDGGSGVDTCCHERFETSRRCENDPSVCPPPTTNDGP